MNTNLLNRIGRAALVSLGGALAMFGSELAGLLPSLSGLETLVVTGLIGLVSFLVERLRDVINARQGVLTYARSEVSLLNRIGRAAITALVGGLAILVSEINGFLPELTMIEQILMAAAAGLLSMGIEYLRDYFELPALHLGGHR